MEVLDIDERTRRPEIRPKKRKGPNGSRLVGPAIIIIIIIMNFNRRNSHGNHGSKRRELAQHARSRGSHAFTHTLYINTVTTTIDISNTNPV